MGIPSCRCLPLLVEQVFVLLTQLYQLLLMLLLLVCKAALELMLLL